MSRQLAAAVAVALIVAGCVGGPVGSRPSPGPSAAASSSRPSSPRSTPSPSPSVAPESPRSTADPTPIPSELRADPVLLDLLPAELGGIPTERYVTGAYAWAGSGDACGVFCPDEPQRVAEWLDANPDDMFVGFAFTDANLDGFPVLIKGYRLPGIVESRWVPKFVEAANGSSAEPVVVDEINVGGKVITRIVTGLGSSPLSWAYLYPHGDALLILYTEIPEYGTSFPETVPDAIEEALAAIP